MMVHCKDDPLSDYHLCRPLPFERSVHGRSNVQSMAFRAYCPWPFVHSSVRRRRVIDPPASDIYYEPLLLPQIWSQLYVIRLHNVAQENFEDKT